MRPSAAAIDSARRKTILLVLLFDGLLIVLTALKSEPTLWTEFEREKNVWTFGNSVHAVLVAVAAYVNYLLLSHDSDSVMRKRAWIWGILPVVFVFFAFDDVLLLHERGGHAIEDALPLVSRQSIVLYMDDIIELAYVAVGALFGLVLLRRASRGRGTVRLFLWGVASMFVATVIGLNPAVKSIPLPLAVIQLLQLLSLYLFFVAFVNSAASEVAWLIEEDARKKAATREDMEVLPYAGEPRITDRLV